MKLYFKKRLPVILDTNASTQRLYHRGRQVRMFYFVIGIVLWGLISNLVYAVPMMINYQGYLTDNSDNPLNASVSMTFALYDVPESGTPLWTETHPNITVTDGVFSVVLGSVVNFTAANLEGERYLGVTVGTDEEMLPRHALTSMAFAIRAGVAESVAEGVVATEQIAQNAVTSDKVADNIITTAKIADGAVTGAKIADLSGHSATELDDITSVGSGAIITNEEREKLKNVVGGNPINPSVNTLDVEQRIKIGTNSLWLGMTDTGQGNSIWTTPMPPLNINQLLIQSYSGNDANTIINDSNKGKVGIGTNDPQAKLHVDGAVFLEQGSPPSPTNDRLYNQGGELYWNGSQLTGKTNSVSWNEITDKPTIISTETDPQVGSNSTNYVPKWDGNALVNGTIYDNGNIGIGTTTPNTKFEVNGTITTQKLATRENQQELITSVGGYDIFKISRTLSDHPDHIGIYERRLELLGAADNTEDLGMVSIYGRIEIIGDKRHHQSGIGPMISLHSTFPNSNDNRHLYMTLGDPWNNPGLSKNDFIIHSWNDSWQDHIQHIVFKSNGNVGIGTINPQYKLDVSGTIRGNNVSPSDQRLKQNIQPLQNSLTKVTQIRGVNFEWKDQEQGAGNQIGMIAQEIEIVFPELVSTDNEGYKSIAYDKMTAVLVEAIKELKAQNDAFKAIICDDHPEKAICQ